METNGLFFIWNVSLLASYFRFIWITMLWVDGHYKYLLLSVRVSTLDVYRRQILTSKVGLRTERVDIRLRGEPW